MFAFTSTIGVMGTQPSAMLLDKFGKLRSMVPACTVIGLSMACAPLTSSFEQFLVLVGAWTVGGTVLGTAPTSFLTDIISAKQRAQALALLRTVGDVGMLSGAVVSGMVADLLGSGQQAMQANGLVLLGLTGFVTLRLSSVLRSG